MCVCVCVCVCLGRQQNYLLPRHHTAAVFNSSTPHSGQDLGLDQSLLVSSDKVPYSLYNSWCRTLETIGLEP